MFGHRNEGAFRESHLDFRPYRRQQPRKPFSVKTFASQPDNRGPCAPGQGEDRMKISVESDTDTMFLLSIQQDCPVVGLAHPDFADVNDIPAFRVQNGACGTGNALIQASSSSVQRMYLVIEIMRRKLQGLAYVFRFEFGIFANEVRPIRIYCQRLNDASNGQAHATDARLSVHHFRIRSNTVPFSSHGTALCCYA